jgi:hypothetical protein
MSKKGVRELIDEARRQNWRCTQTAKGHWMCLAPDGIGAVVVSGTPSDTRSLKNAISRMKQHGFVWPRR